MHDRVQQVTWKDLPVLVFGFVGFGWGLVAIATLLCRHLGCIEFVAGPGGFIVISALGLSELLYLRWWRTSRTSALCVTLLAYVVALAATTAVLLN